MKFGHPNLVSDIIYKLNFVNRCTLVVDQVYPNQVFVKYNNPEVVLSIVRIMVKEIDAHMKSVAATYISDQNCRPLQKN